ncbi:MarR family winged helix-turn-helix transcriptional regulator [Streptosporangium sp. DT93]|uniref:MarR family winged helix-turn-helix transcriptional regulator n=1 Tax=Streptosporangium sp. DT93 TaxID=3393428 RepID=UPI003CEA5721
MFPDDELRRLLRLLAKAGGLLEPQGPGELRLSLSEVFALGELSEGETLSQRELATRLGLEKSTVSRLAAGMERRGWLSRERDPANRRFYRLRLTEPGRAVAGEVGSGLRARHDVLFGELTDEERAGLALGLAGLARALRGGAHGESRARDASSTPSPRDGSAGPPAPRAHP